MDAIDADTLRALQAPIKAKYREAPDAAVITLKAAGEIDESRSPARWRRAAPWPSPACIRHPAAAAWSSARATCCSKLWWRAPA